MDVAIRVIHHLSQQALLWKDIFISLDLLACNNISAADHWQLLSMLGEISGTEVKQCSMRNLAANHKYKKLFSPIFGQVQTDRQTDGQTDRRTDRREVTHMSPPCNGHRWAQKIHDGNAYSLIWKYCENIVLSMSAGRYAIFLHNILMLSYIIRGPIGLRFYGLKNAVPRVFLEQIPLYITCI